MIPASNPSAPAFIAIISDKIKKPSIIKSINSVERIVNSNTHNSFCTSNECVDAGRCEEKNVFVYVDKNGKAHLAYITTPRVGSKEESTNVRHCIKIIDSDGNETEEEVQLKVYGQGCTSQTPDDAVDDISLIFEQLGVIKDKTQIESLRAPTFDGEQKFMPMQSLFVSSDHTKQQNNPLQFAMNYTNVSGEMKYMGFAVSLYDSTFGDSENMLSWQKKNSQKSSPNINNTTDKENQEIKEVQERLKANNGLINNYFRENIENKRFTIQQVVEFIEHSASQKLTQKDIEIQQDLSKHVEKETGFCALSFHAAVVSMNGTNFEYKAHTADFEKLSLYRRLIQILYRLKEWIMSWFVQSAGQGHSQSMSGINSAAASELDQSQVRSQSLSKINSVAVRDLDQSRGRSQSEIGVGSDGSTRSRIPPFTYHCVKKDVDF